ncbi:MAG: YaaR family protein [Oscillospiraceae bacterium]|nr:YaaR family protein [Oscillospiraceae bacterium]
MGVKVNNVNRPDPGGYTSRGHSVRNTDESEALLFKRTLTDLSREVYIARLHELKKSIDDQGKRLADKVDVKEFEKFRSLIREFIDEVVSNGYTFSKEDAFASRGRHRYIATIQIVDEKLDELAKQVMEENAEQIDIINKIDDIRGLLLDMMI